jgi:hypothetical protein
MIFNENEIKNKIQTYKMKFEHLYEKFNEWKSSNMDKEDKLDESLDESFPASDSPSHRSKSHIDQKHH